MLSGKGICIVLKTELWKKNAPEVFYHSLVSTLLGNAASDIVSVLKRAVWEMLYSSSESEGRINRKEAPSAI